MTTIRIDELVTIPALADNDLIAVHDSGEGVTSKTTVADLKEIFLTPQVFQDNAPSIIKALNDYLLSGSAQFELNAAHLEGEGGEYYLNYDNFTNTPDIPTSLLDLENPTAGNGGYARVVNGTLVVQEVIRDGDGNVSDGPSTTDITTDFIPEGTNNKYASDGFIEDFFDREFANYFNTLSPTFDKGFSVDSLTDVPGTFVQGNYLATNLPIDLSTGASNRIQIADASLRPHYRVDDAIRVYGAGIADHPILANAPTTPTNFTVSAEGFAFNDTDGVYPSTFSYKLAFFDYTTGEISPASSALDLQLYIPNEVWTAFNNSTDLTVYDIFNAERFVTVQLGSIPEGQGVLIYRNAGRVGVDENGIWRLAYVMGPKDIERGSFIDYYNFDYGVWTEKREADNSYLVNGELRNSSPDSEVVRDGLMHFPETAPTTSLRGWVDTTINRIEENVTGFAIVLQEIVSFNEAGTQQRKSFISHNDTALISAAIQAASSGANKAINLNAKTYVVDNLRIPNDFGIVGVPYITRLKKMPWSGYATQTGSTNSILESSAGVARSISVTGVDIDGTSNLQFLMNDSSSTNGTDNYIVDFGFQAESCLFDKVRIVRPIGGGIYASLPVDLKVTSSEITNSGNTDRYEYTPLQIDQGQNSVITNNRFQNFTQYIDASVTDKGIISGNIIANVGSGILVYGSKFLITNPNTLVGPAGEFLPTPDILNAEYEAINLNLDEAYMNSISGQSGEFQGPALTYQENGELFDLNNEAGLFADTVVKAFMIEKTTDGSESVWTFTDGSNPVIAFEKKANADYSLGQFGFNIPEADVLKIKGPYLGSGTQGTYSYKYLSGNLINTSTGNPYFADYPYVIDTVVNSGTAVNVERKTHVGLAWAAIHTRDVPVANILQVKEEDPGNPGTYINVTAGDTSTNDTYYVQIQVTDAELAVFSVGTQAALQDHGIVVTTTGDSQFGTIVSDVSQNPEGTLRLVGIQYSGATSITAGNSGEAGTAGTLNIKNTFTLAQGRIL